MHALIFDFDGLILDTETADFVVWSEVFREHGVEMPPDYWATYIGRGAEQIMERPAQLLARLSETFHETPALYEARRARIRARIDEEDARPGVRELIQEAHEARIPIGIASSSPHAWVDRYLSRLGLMDEFEVIACADDVARAKPFPDLYLLACERLGGSPSGSIALEDSPNGLAAAKEAGLFAVAVPNSVTALLDLSAADWRLETLAGVTLQDLDCALSGALAMGCL